MYEISSYDPIDNASHEMGWVLRDVVERPIQLRRTLRKLREQYEDFSILVEQVEQVRQVKQVTRHARRR